MAAYVGIDIENDQVVGSAMDNEIRFVFVGIVTKAAKNAAPGFRVSRVVGSDVFVTPGTPQPVHS
jgi:hypothetical protein